MFWKKQLRLPVTEDDKEWVEDGLLLLSSNFGKDYFRNITTILPNRRFYDCEFRGTEDDAQFVLEQTKVYMDIENVDFKLVFFSDEPVYMDDGTLLTSPADLYGKWKSASGVYEESKDGTIIYIKQSLLKDPVSLIATMAHELAHYILLGEGRMETNDEYLTDLVALSYGFGIFLGNTRFNFGRFSNVQGQGWEMSSQGYLPEQVIAYTMAWLAVYRNEEPSWKTLLNKDMLKYFDQSLEYITDNPDKIKFE